MTLKVRFYTTAATTMFGAPKFRAALLCALEPDAERNKSEILSLSLFCVCVCACVYLFYIHIYTRIFTCRQLHQCSFAVSHFHRCSQVFA